MLIQLDDSKAFYLQIFDAFQQAILKGELKAGTQLPSSRQQANLLGVSRNTVLLAYEQLIAEGYFETKQGQGTFVSSDLVELNVAKKASSLRSSQLNVSLSTYAETALNLKPAGGMTYSIQPELNLRYGLAKFDPKLMTLWKKYLNQAANKIDINYGDAQGDYHLRTVLSEYLQKYRSVSCSADTILITSGSQQALFLISQALLNEGDKVVVEEPCYQGATKVFTAHNAELIYAQVDEEGMTLPKQAAKLAYITPSHQFPTGMVMTLSRRLELLDWARQQHAFIIEDDYDSEYRYEGKPIAALQGLAKMQNVIYVGTFSKTLFPSLRLGFMVLPEALIETFKALKWLSDRQNSSLEQVALASFIEEGQFERHLRRTRVVYAHYRQVLLTALDEHFADSIEVMGSKAGIHIVVWFKKLDASLEPIIKERAQTEGLGIYPISNYYNIKPKRLGFLIGYTALSEMQIKEAVKRLAKLITQL